MVPLLLCRDKEFKAEEVVHASSVMAFQVRRRPRGHDVRAATQQQHSNSTATAMATYDGSKRSVCEDCSERFDDHTFITILNVGASSIRYTVPSFPKKIFSCTA